MSIKIHPQENFIKMRKAGKLAAEILDYIGDYVQKGVTTNYLNDLCHQKIIDNGAIPAPLNYRGFPKSICTSINREICHGIPSDKKLKDGDIVNIDVTVIVDGWHGDTSRMYYIGKPSIKARRLCEVTYEAMMRGIEQVRDGATLADIGREIQKYAEGKGYSVVRDFCGHGIGQVFHDEPNVIHYYDKKNEKTILQEGMFFTIEPMINVGTYHAVMLRDYNKNQFIENKTKYPKNTIWPYGTKDKSLSAQFEHTLAVTKDGYEIFTLGNK